VNVDDVIRARTDRHEHLHGRELRVAIGSATLLVLVALALPILRPPSGEVDVPLVAALLVAVGALSLIEFEIWLGAGVPTQIAFVPLIFVVPPSLIPLAALAAFATAAPFAGRPRGRGVLLAAGSCWFAVGPALVLLAARDVTGGAVLVVGLIALAAQIAFDLGNWLLAAYLTRESAPEPRVIAAVYSLDVCLTPVALAGVLAGQAVSFGELLPLGAIGVLLTYRAERSGRITTLATLSDAYRGTALLLAQMLVADDEYTGDHSTDVVALAHAVAVDLGMTAAATRSLELAALLHDVGKIHVPKSILHKDGPLTDAEWEVLRRHPEAGAAMLLSCGGLLADVAEAVRHHHERYDGSGYPDGLAGDDIPLESRILAACDTFSAITTDRPYSRARTSAEAIAELRAVAGTQLDPAVVAVLERVVAGAGETAQAAA
jgi:HD domain